MLEMLKKDKLNIIIILIDIFSIITVGINLNKNLGFWDSFDGNSFIYFIFAIFYFYILKKVFLIKDKRLIICTLIIALILTLFEIIGFSINNYTDLSAIFHTKTTLIKTLLKSMGLFFIMYSFLIMVYTFFDYIFKKSKEEINGNQKKKKNIVIYFFCIWLILFLLYLPWFLAYNPGILTFDSINQINQATGNLELKANHPLIHTIFIKICLKIGVFINGTYEMGVAIYSISQMLFMTGVFAFSICYMYKKMVNKYILLLVFIFFAFFPVFPIYAITMWKDIPFAISLILLIICLSELVYNQEKYLKSKMKNILFIFVLLLVMLVRNNGYYVVLLTIPFIFFVAKKNWRKIIIILVIPVVIYKLIYGPLLTFLNIKQTSITEALSVPLQQLARVEINKGNEMTKQEYEQIHKFLKCDNIKSIYKTWLSDPVKMTFDEEYFKNNKKEFITLWFKLFTKYPVQYLEAFLCNSVGYWYPETQYRVVEKGIYNSLNVHDVNIKRTPLIDENILLIKDDFIDRRQIPIISMMFSIGFNMWLLFICCMYLIYKKRFREVLIFIPFFILWLTTLASPIYAEFRYIFGVFTCLPLLVAITINTFDDKNC